MTSVPYPSCKSIRIRRLIPNWKELHLTSLPLLHKSSWLQSCSHAYWIMQEQNLKQRTSSKVCNGACSVMLPSAQGMGPWWCRSQVHRLTYRIVPAYTAGTSSTTSRILHYNPEDGGHAQHACMLGLKRLSSLTWFACLDHAHNMPHMHTLCSRGMAYIHKPSYSLHCTTLRSIKLISDCFAGTARV